MDFTFAKSFEIDPALLNDTFHNMFYIRDIESSTEALRLLNSKNKDNEMIERGNFFGILIVFSKSSNKYYLFHKDPTFPHEYTKLMLFKKMVESYTDDYSPEQLKKLLDYFDSSSILVKSVFSRIRNTEPIRYKCINLLDFPNDYVIKYSHDMKLDERITRNPFLNEISTDKTSYYNFVIDRKGIIIGEVFDSLENGVVHHLLVDNPDDEVYIAGEIKISNNKLEYNFFSGTYSAPQNTSTNPILLYYLELLVGKIFKLYRSGTKPLRRITLTHIILLPRKPFDRKELEFFCSKFSNSIQKVPSGNRCINNTYNNLTPVIKEQIIRNFETNSNLLCDDSFDRLFPTVTPVFDLVEERTIFDTIENELKKFGLNIKLGTMDELREQFIKLVDDPLNFATFTEGVTVDASGSKSIEFNKVRPDGSVERKIFTFKKYLSAGSFNKTDIYIDKTTHNYKEYIFRSSTSYRFEDQFKSFYENLKHIILYIIIRKRLGNKKFIPQPYHFGLKKDAITKKITLYMIMEKGKSTLQTYLETASLTPDHIKKLIFSIYCDLYELSFLTIKDGDILTSLNFKHNDFKCNNLVVSEIGAPLIIDFGLSRFTLTDAGRSIEFISCEPSIKSIYYKSNGFNIVHDVLQLIASFTLINKPGFKPFEILKFTNNQNSNILDTNVIVGIISSLYGLYSINSPILFRQFYEKFNLRSIGQSGYTIEITPYELATNLGLTVADRIIDKFEKKYKKYKIKYLNLVSKLQNIESK
jgi:hypothetical protein